MRVAVGSQNPIKVAAVSRMIDLAFTDAETIGVDVPSGVPEQPIGDEQTRQGALNRARTALKDAQADLAIGLEGGVVYMPHGVFTMGWVAIIDRSGRIGLSQSPWLQLPPTVADAIAGGQELGPVMDRLTGQKNTKQHGGAVGFLTKGLFDRQAAWELSVACALAPFLHSNLYDQMEWR